MVKITEVFDEEEEDQIFHPLSSAAPPESDRDAEDWIAQESEKLRSTASSNSSQNEETAKDREKVWRPSSPPLSSSSSSSPSSLSDVQEPEEVIEVLSPEVLSERLETARKLKDQGNVLFRQSLFEGAIEEYSKAIDLLPDSVSEEKTILLSNRAAAQLNMELFDEAIRSASHAISLNPSYPKSYLRKAQSHEKKREFKQAFEEFKKLLELDPTNPIAREAVVRLPDQIKQKETEDLEEVKGKLKELGNTVLGFFGLSLDNFQINQDPSSGGCSISLNQ